MSNASSTKAHSGSHNGALATVTDELDGLKSTVTEGAQETLARGQRVVKAAGAAATEVATDFRDMAGKKIAAKPFTSVAIAAGVGVAIGAAFVFFKKR